jgi:hypothetical protein
MEAPGFSPESFITFEIASALRPSTGSGRTLSLSKGRGSQSDCVAISIFVIARRHEVPTKPACLQVILRNDGICPLRHSLNDDIVLKISSNKVVNGPPLNDLGFGPKNVELFFALRPRLRRGLAAKSF